MSTGEIENHPADDPLIESDEFMRSMESVNFKVYEISKLVNRIYHLENRVTLRLKWMKLSNRLTRIFNSTCTRKFANLSKSYDDFILLYTRNRFLRWKNRYKWVKFTRIQLSNERHNQFQSFIPEILEHKQQVKINRWESFTKKLMQAEKQERIRSALEENELRIKLQYFFDLWQNRYYNKQRIKEARLSKWISLVYRYSAYCQRNDLIRQANRIRYRNNWKLLMNELKQKNITITLNKALSYDRNHALFINLITKYQMHCQRDLLIAAEFKLRQTNNWNYFKSSLLLNYYDKTFKKAKLASDTASKVRSMAYQLLHKDQTDLLIMAQKKRQAKVENQKRLEMEKNYLYFWFQRAISKRSTRRLMRIIYNKSLNEYMFSIYNLNAIIIQRWFRSILQKQNQLQRLLFNCFQAWRKVPLRLTFNSVEFPQMSIRINPRLNFDLDFYRPNYNLDFSILKPLYEQNFVYRNQIIDEVTKKNALSIQLSIIPQPEFSMEPFYAARFISSALKTLDQKREAEINNEPIPFSINFDQPMKFVSSFVPENAEKLKDEEYFEEPEISDDFLNSIAETATKRKLRTVGIPLSVKNGCTDIDSLQRIGEIGPISDLINQYDNLYDVNDPDFQFLGSISVENLEKIDQYEPNEIPMNCEFALDAMNEINISPIYRISNDTVSVEPLPEITKIELKENKIDDDLFVKAVQNLGLEKTTDQVLSLYEPPFDYLKRDEYWKLLIYDHSIEEEAANNINFDDVFITAACLYNEPIKHLPPYCQIETILERKLEIDEKRIEKPLLDVFNEIKIDPFSIDFFGPSPYEEKHPEDEIDFEIPLEKLKVQNPLLPFIRLRLKRFESSDVQKMAKYYLSIFSLTNDDLINSNYLVHLSSFALSNAKALIYKPLSDPLLPEKIVKKSMTFLNSNDSLNLVDNDILSSFPGFKSIYLPESTKPRFDDIYDTKLPDLNKLNSNKNILLLQKIKPIGKKIPKVDDIKSDDQLENGLNDQIDRLSSKKVNALDNFALSEAPEFEYIDDLEFQLFNDKFVDIGLFKDFTKSEIPESEIQLPPEERATDIAEDLFKDHEYKISTNDIDKSKGKKLKFANQFQLNEPIEDPLKDVDFNDVLLEMLNKISFEKMPIDNKLVNFERFEQKEEEIPKLDDTFVSFDGLNFDFNNLLNHLSDISWEDIQCMQLYKLIIPRPKLSLIPVELNVIPLKELTYSPSLYKNIDFIDDDGIFDGILNDIASSIGKSKIKCVNDNFIVPDQSISDDVTNEIAEEVYNELESIFINDLSNVTAKQLHNIDLPHANKYPSIVEGMLNNVIDESLSFMKETEPEFEVDDDFLNEIANEIEESFAPDQFFALSAKNALDNALLQTVPPKLSIMDMLNNVIDESLNILKEEPEIEEEEEEMSEIEFNENDFDFDVNKTVLDIRSAKSDAVKSATFKPDLQNSSVQFINLLEKVIDDDIELMKQKPTIKYEMPQSAVNYLELSLVGDVTDIGLNMNVDSIFIFEKDDEEEAFDKDISEKLEKEEQYELPEKYIRHIDETINGILANNVEPIVDLFIDENNLRKDLEEEEESEAESEITYELPTKIIKNEEQALLEEIINISFLRNENITIHIDEFNEQETKQTEIDVEPLIEEEEMNEEQYELPKNVIANIEENVKDALINSAQTVLELFVNEELEQEEESKAEPENVVTYELPTNIIENEEQTLLDEIINMTLSQNGNITIHVDEFVEQEPTEKIIQPIVEEEEEKNEGLYELPEKFIRHIDETTNDILISNVRPIVELFIDEENLKIEQEEESKTESANAITYELPTNIIENEEQTLLDEIINMTLSLNENIAIHVDELNEQEESTEEISKEIEQEEPKTEEEEKTEDQYKLPESIIVNIEENVKDTLINNAQLTLDLFIDEDKLASEEISKDEEQEKIQNEEEEKNEGLYELPEKFIRHIDETTNDILISNVRPIVELFIDEENLKIEQEEESKAEPENASTYELPTNIIENEEQTLLDEIINMTLSLNENIAIHVDDFSEEETKPKETIIPLIQENTKEKEESEIEEEEKTEEGYELPKNIITHIDETTKDILINCSNQIIDMPIDEENISTEEISKEETEAEPENAITYELPTSIIENEEQTLLDEVINMTLSLNENITIHLDEFKEREQEEEPTEELSKEIEQEEPKTEEEEKTEEGYELPKNIINHIDETTKDILINCSNQIIDMPIDEENISTDEMSKEETETELTNAITYELPTSIIENEEQTLLEEIINMSLSLNENITIHINELNEQEESAEEVPKEIEQEEPKTEEEEKTEEQYELPKNIINHIDETTKDILVSNVQISSELFIDEDKIPKEKIAQKVEQEDQETTESKMEEEEKTEDQYELPKNIINHIDETTKDILINCSNQIIDMPIDEENISTDEMSKEETETELTDAITYELPTSIIENEEQTLLEEIVNMSLSLNENITIHLDEFNEHEESAEEVPKEIEQEEPKTEEEEKTEEQYELPKNIITHIDETTNDILINCSNQIINMPIDEENISTEEAPKEEQKEQEIIEAKTEEEEEEKNENQYELPKNIVLHIDETTKDILINCSNQIIDMPIDEENISTEEIPKEIETEEEPANAITYELPTSIIENEEQTLLEEIVNMSLSLNENITIHVDEFKEREQEEEPTEEISKEIEQEEPKTEEEEKTEEQYELPKNIINHIDETTKDILINCVNPNIEITIDEENVSQQEEQETTEPEIETKEEDEIEKNDEEYELPTNIITHIDETTKDILINCTNQIIDMTIDEENVSTEEISKEEMESEPANAITYELPTSIVENEEQTILDEIINMNLSHNSNITIHFDEFKEREQEEEPTEEISKEIEQEEPKTEEEEKTEDQYELPKSTITHIDETTNDILINCVNPNIELTINEENASSQEEKEQETIEPEIETKEEEEIEKNDEEYELPTNIITHIDETTKDILINCSNQIIDMPIDEENIPTEEIPKEIETEEEPENLVTYELPTNIIENEEQTLLEEIINMSLSLNENITIHVDEFKEREQEEEPTEEISKEIEQEEPKTEEEEKTEDQYELPKSIITHIDETTNDILINCVNPNIEITIEEEKEEEIEQEEQETIEPEIETKEEKEDEEIEKNEEEYELPTNIITHVDETTKDILINCTKQIIDMPIDEDMFSTEEIPKEIETEAEPANVFTYELPTSIVENEEQTLLDEIINMSLSHNSNITIHFDELNEEVEEETKPKETIIPLIQEHDKEKEESEPAISEEEKTEEIYELPNNIIKHIDETTNDILINCVNPNIELTINEENNTEETPKSIEQESQVESIESEIDQEKEEEYELPTSIITQIDETANGILINCTNPNIEMIIDDENISTEEVPEEIEAEVEPENVITYELPSSIIENEEQTLLDEIINMSLSLNEKITIHIDEFEEPEQEEPAEEISKEIEPETEAKEEEEKNEEEYELPKNIITHIDETTNDILINCTNPDIELAINEENLSYKGETDEQEEQEAIEPKVDAKEEEEEKNEEEYEIPKSIIVQIDETVNGILINCPNPNIEMIINEENISTEEAPEEEISKEIEEEPANVITYELPTSIVENEEQTILDEIINMSLSHNSNITIHIDELNEEVEEEPKPKETTIPLIQEHGKEKEESEPAISEEEKTEEQYELPNNIIKHIDETTNDILINCVNPNIEITIEEEKEEEIEQEEQETIEPEIETKEEKEKEDEEIEKNEEEYELPTNIITHVDETTKDILINCTNLNIEIPINEENIPAEETPKEIEPEAESEPTNVISYELPTSIIENEEQTLLDEIVNLSFSLNENITIHIDELNEPEQEEEPKPKEKIIQPNEEPESEKEEKEEEPYELPNNIITHIDETTKDILINCVNPNIEITIEEEKEEEIEQEEQETIEPEIETKEEKEKEDEEIEKNDEEYELPTNIITHIDETTKDILINCTNPNIEIPLINEENIPTEEVPEEIEAEVEPENVITYELPTSIIENEEQTLLDEIVNLSFSLNENITIHVDEFKESEQEEPAEELSKEIEQEEPEIEEKQKNEDQYELPTSIIKHIDETTNDILIDCVNPNIEITIEETNEVSTKDVESSKDIESSAKEEILNEPNTKESETEIENNEKEQYELPKEVVTQFDETTNDILINLLNPNIELVINEENISTEETPEEEISKEIEEEPANVISYELPTSIVENEEQTLLDEIINMSLSHNSNITIHIDELNEEVEEEPKPKETIIPLIQEHGKEKEESEPAISDEEKTEEPYELPNNIIKHIDETTNDILINCVNPNIEMAINEENATEETPKLEATKSIEQEEPPLETIESEQEKEVEEYELPKNIVTHIDETINDILINCPNPNIDMIINEENESTEDSPEEETTKEIEVEQEPSKEVSYTLPTSIIENEEQTLLNEIINMSLSQNEKITIHVDELNEQEPEERQEETETSEPKLEEERKEQIEEPYELPKEVITHVDETVNNILIGNVQPALFIILEEEKEIKEGAKEKEIDMEPELETKEKENDEQISKEEDASEEPYELPKEIITQVDEVTNDILINCTNPNIEMQIDEENISTEETSKGIEPEAESEPENVISYELPTSIIENEEQTLLDEIINMSFSHNSNITIHFDELNEEEETKPKETIIPLIQEHDKEKEELEQEISEEEKTEEPYELPNNIIKHIDETTNDILINCVNPNIEITINEENASPQGEEIEQEEQETIEQEIETKEEKEEEEIEKNDEEYELPTNIIKHIDETTNDILINCVNPNIEITIEEEKEEEIEQEEQETIEPEIETKEEKEKEEEIEKNEEEYELPTNIITHIDETTKDILINCTNPNIEIPINEESISTEEIPKEIELEAESEPTNVISYELPTSIIENEEQTLLDEIINMRLSLNENITIHIDEYNEQELEEEPKPKEKIIQPNEEPESEKEEKEEEPYDLPNNIITHIDETTNDILINCVNPNIEITIEEEKEEEIEQEEQETIEPEIETKEEKEKEDEEIEKNEEEYELPTNIIKHIDETTNDILINCVNPNIEIPINEEFSPSEETEETPKEIEPEAEPANVITYELPTSIVENEAQTLLDEIINMSLSHNSNITIHFDEVNEEEETKPKETIIPLIQEHAKEKEESEPAISEEEKTEELYELPNNIIKHIDETANDILINCVNPNIELTINEENTSVEEPPKEETNEQIKQEEQEIVEDTIEKEEEKNEEEYELPKNIVTHIDETINDILINCLNPNIDMIINEENTSTEDSPEEETTKEIEVEQEPSKEISYTLPTSIIENEEQTLLNEIINMSLSQNEKITIHVDELNEPEPEEEPKPTEKIIQLNEEPEIEEEQKKEEPYELPNNIIKHIDETISDILINNVQPTLGIFLEEENKEDDYALPEPEITKEIESNEIDAEPITQEEIQTNNNSPMNEYELPDNIITHIDDTINDILINCPNPNIEITINEENASPQEEKEEEIEQEEQETIEPEIETKEEKEEEEIEKNDEEYELPTNIITHIDETTKDILINCTNPNIEIPINEEFSPSEETEEKPKEIETEGEINQEKEPANVITYELPTNIIENEEQTLLGEIFNMSFSLNENITIHVDEFNEQEPEQEEPKEEIPRSIEQEEAETEPKSEEERKEQIEEPYELPKNIIKHIDETITDILINCPNPSIEMVFDEIGEMSNNEDNDQIESPKAEIQKETEPKESETENKDEENRTEETYELPNNIISHFDETVRDILINSTNPNIEMAINEDNSPTDEMPKETETEEEINQEKEPENAITYELPKSIVENEEQTILGEIINMSLSLNEKITIHVDEFKELEQEEPKPKEKTIPLIQEHSKEKEEEKPEIEEEQKKEEPYELPNSIIKHIDETISDILINNVQPTLGIFLEEENKEDDYALPEPEITKEIESNEIDTEPITQEEIQTNDNSPMDEYELPDSIVAHIDNTINGILISCPNPNIDIIIEEENAPVDDASKEEAPKEIEAKAEPANAISYELPTSIIENEEQTLLDEIINMSLSHNSNITIHFDELNEEEAKLKETIIPLIQEHDKEKEESEPAISDEEKTEEPYELPNNIIKHIEGTANDILINCVNPNIELTINEENTTEETPKSIEQESQAETIESEVSKEKEEEEKVDAKVDSPLEYELPKSIITHINETTNDILINCPNPNIDMIINEENESTEDSPEEETTKEIEVEQEPSKEISYTLPTSIIENEEQTLLNEIINMSLSQNEKITITPNVELENDDEIENIQPPQTKHRHHHEDFSDADIEASNLSNQQSKSDHGFLTKAALQHIEQTVNSIFDFSVGNDITFYILESDTSTEKM